MQISSSSGASSSMTLQMLKELMGAAGPTARQNMPEETQEGGKSGPPPGRPPGPPPAKGDMAPDTMMSLLDAQAEKPTAEDVASELLKALDTDGDGSVGQDEVKAALGSETTRSGASVSDGFGKLDTDGDGKLSASELTQGLQTLFTARQSRMAYMASPVTAGLVDSQA